MCSSSVHRPVFSPVVVVGGGAETWAAVGGWHIVVAVAARLRYVFFWAVLGGAFPPPHRVLKARGMPRGAGVRKRAAARELTPCRTASGRKRPACVLQPRKTLSPLLKLGGSALAFCTPRGTSTRCAGASSGYPLRSLCRAASSPADATFGHAALMHVQRGTPRCQGAPQREPGCAYFMLRVDVSSSKRFGGGQFASERSCAGGRRPLRTPRDGYGARTRLEPGLWGLHRARQKRGA